MSDYKRKTSFIDYYINGVKGRNIGIVKQKFAEGEYAIWVNLFGLENWKTMTCNVSMGNSKGKKKLFTVNIQNGKGFGEYHFAEWETNESYEKLFFDLGNNCCGIADLLQFPGKRNAPDAEEQQPENVAGNVENERTIPEEETPEPLFEELTEEEEEILADAPEEQPDKWESIKKKYPILYPFRGQGPYVSIKPVDLQLLNGKYHHLSNNSYLMHGFYQYKHMILGEYSMEKGTFFYVGVPGAFVKKEQTAAAMFGFEGYEHSGDLGYYLYRVEL